MVIMIPMMSWFTTNPNPNPKATASINRIMRLSLIFAIYISPFIFIKNNAFIKHYYNYIRKVCKTESKPTILRKKWRTLCFMFPITI